MSASNELGENTSLLLLLEKGDGDAFDLLYKKYWRYVFDHAYKRLKDASLAEDVAQNPIKAFSIGQMPMPWMCSLMHTSVPEATPTKLISINGLPE